MLVSDLVFLNAVCHIYMPTEHFYNNVEQQMKPDIAPNCQCYEDVSQL